VIRAENVIRRIDGPGQFESVSLIHGACIVG
jgi:hypothetical protein